MIDFSECRHLKGGTALERLIELAPDRKNFLKEMNNYLQAGVVVNSPRMFLMAKPIESSKEPDGQWWVEKPDAWYIRWASGEGSMKLMMSMGEPLPFVVFRRFKDGHTGKLKRYEWKRLHERICA